MGARNQADETAFFAADVGRTFKLTCNGNTAVQAPSDTDGALPPGRYLVQVLDIAALRVWIDFVKFEKGVGAPSIATDAPSMPLDANGIVAFEINILKDYNDRIVARLAGAGAPLIYLTQISRSV